MGISSNQARLMTLTARQHDLELRAQQISAEKMVKTSHSQKWAMEYSQKLNIFTQQQQGLQPTYLKEVEVPVTVEWLNDKGYKICRPYNDGNIEPMSYISYINNNNPNFALCKSIVTDMNTLTAVDCFKYLTSSQGLSVRNLIFNAYLQNLGLSKTDLKGVSYTDIQPYYVSPNDDGTCESVKFWIPYYSTDPSTAIDIDPAIIQQMTGYAGNSGTRYMRILITERPTGLVEVPYDGVDINEIKAEYDSAMASLSSDEKLLDMELTQINTEHKAVKTEYDSVKGLVGENVDKSFNVFG